MASLIKVSFIEFLSKALNEMYYANKVGIPKELLCLYSKMKYIISYLTGSSTSKWWEMVSKIRSRTNQTVDEVHQKRNVPVYLWNEFLLETLHFSVTA